MKYKESAIHLMLAILERDTDHPITNFFNLTVAYTQNFTV